LQLANFSEPQTFHPKFGIFSTHYNNSKLPIKSTLTTFPQMLANSLFSSGSFLNEFSNIILTTAGSNTDIFDEMLILG